MEGTASPQPSEVQSVAGDLQSTSDLPLQDTTIPIREQVVEAALILVSDVESDLTTESRSKESGNQRQSTCSSHCYTADDELDEAAVSDPKRLLIKAFNQQVKRPEEKLRNFAKNNGSSSDPNFPEQTASTSQDASSVVASGFNMTESRKKRHHVSHAYDIISSGDVEACATANKAYKPWHKEQVREHLPEQQTVGGCWRYVTMLKVFAWKVRHSYYWLSFLYILLALPLSALYMGVSHSNQCISLFDLSIFVLGKAVLGLLILLPNLAALTIKEFPSRSSIMRKSFNIIMIVLLISLILFEEILILPDVEAHGNCWTLYDYTFYLNIAILVLFIPAVFVHFDILFDACFGGCTGVPTEPTED